jgi:hypothetical protein
MDVHPVEPPGAAIFLLFSLCPTLRFWYLMETFRSVKGIQA